VKVSWESVKHETTAEIFQRNVGLVKPLIILKMMYCLKEVNVWAITVVSSDEDFRAVYDQYKLHTTLPFFE
jgi:hypothetical protein